MNHHDKAREYLNGSIPNGSYDQPTSPHAAKSKDTGTARLIRELQRRGVKPAEMNK